MNVFFFMKCEFGFADLFVCEATVQLICDKYDRLIY